MDIHTAQKTPESSVPISLPTIRVDMEGKGEVVVVLEILHLVGTNLVVFSPACFSLVGTKVTEGIRVLRV